MKKLLVVLLFFVAMTSYAQTAVVESNGRVVILSDNGSYISVVETSGE
jgi:hypothetical protein